MNGKFFLSSSLSPFGHGRALHEPSTELGDDPCGARITRVERDAQVEVVERDPEGAAQDGHGHDALDRGVDALVDAPVEQVDELLGVAGEPLRRRPPRRGNVREGLPRRPRGQGIAWGGFLPGTSRGADARQAFQRPAVETTE